MGPQGFGGAGYGQTGPPYAQPPSGRGKTLGIAAGVAGLLVVALVIIVLVAHGKQGSTGNGEGSKDGNTVATDARSAFQGTRTVHIKGKIQASGNDIGIDLHLDNKNNGQGTVTIGGLPINVVELNGKTYMQGREFFTKQGGPQAGALIGDRWVVVPADTPDFKSFTDLFSVQTDGAKFFTPSGTVIRDAVTTINGQQAITIKGSDGNLYVAGDGPPYPLRLDGNGSGTSGTKGQLDFLDYNQSVNIQAPPNPLDLSTLGQQTPPPS